MRLNQRENLHPIISPVENIANRELGKWIILVAEDDQAIRDFVTAVLVREGWHVLQAENGIKALYLWRANIDSVRFLITDVDMPEMTGPQLVSTVWRSRPQLSVLYISGRPLVGVAAEHVTRHGARFLGKPFTLRALLDAVLEH